MSESELINRLLEDIVSRVKPSLPISIDLWDVATIAQYLKKTPMHVRERIACLPSFPKAIRVPTTTGRGQPLYEASEIITWSKSFKDKN